ncbi:hypothetical protein [Crocosphaera sp. Alani8]|uniref:hypothetical protein n=1 Tax=Crocosphaera sp. Alani8 TaxID=3038952 RepID=UPI00313EAEDF
MSKINDLDAESILVPNTPDKLVRLWGKERRDLAKNSKVDKETLELLVCSTHYLGEITQGRAAEILNLHRLEFRDLYLKWEKEYQENLD